MAIGLLRTSLILLVATTSAKSANKSKKGKGLFSGGLRAAKKMFAKATDVTSKDSSIKKNLLGNGKSLIKNIANLALDDSDKKPFWESAVDLVKQSAVDVVNDLANGEHDSDSVEKLPVLVSAVNAVKQLSGDSDHDDGSSEKTPVLISALNAVQDLVGSDSNHEKAEKVPFWMSAMKHILA